MFPASNSTSTETNYADFTYYNNNHARQSNNSYMQPQESSSCYVATTNYGGQLMIPDSERETSSFPKFDELNAYINSEEFIEYQVCKQEPQSSPYDKSVAQQEQQQQQQAHLHLQRQQQQQRQQVNSLEETFISENNNNNNNKTLSSRATSENNSHQLKARANCNINLSAGQQYYSQQQQQQQQVDRDNQETLLTPQVQLDDDGNNTDDSRRLQYLNQIQSIKESIYQETKSFIYHQQQPEITTSEQQQQQNNNNMANMGNSRNRTSQQQQQQSNGLYNTIVPYRDIYDNISEPQNNTPYVEVVEQPAKCSLRFRYKCEGRSAGSLPGVNSRADNKTYPSIQIRNYTGKAVVVISCVTKEAPYLAHPHNIVGKEGCKKGTCTVVINNDPNVPRSFSSLGIQCVKRKEIEQSLTERESIQVDPFRNGFAHKLSSSNIDLNVVRLCFQVFIVGSTPNRCDVPLTPVVSDPIHDKKAMSDLVITKLLPCSAPASGGSEIILLCDRISRDDIKVRFFEEREGKLHWQAFVEVGPTDVHKQVAICFKAPRYENGNIRQPISANIQLVRPSDSQVSEPRVFQFLPSESDEDQLARKKHKWDQSIYSQHNNYPMAPRINQIGGSSTRPLAQQRLQQHESPRIAQQEGPSYQQQQLQPGRSSTSPQSRIASPVTPGQANSPVAPIDQRRILSRSPNQQATSVVISSSQHQQQQQNQIQNQTNYVIEATQLQHHHHRQQQLSSPVREFIANDGKVVRLVGIPHDQQQSLAAGSLNATSNRQHENQQQQQDEDNKAQLGLSLARIDSSQLIQANEAFNPNVNLDLGSSISIHLNGNGNGSANSHAAPMP